MSAVRGIGVRAGTAWSRAGSMPGPLGSVEPQGAVLFSRRLTADGRRASPQSTIPNLQAPTPYTYRRCEQGSCPGSAGRPRPPRRVASRPRAGSARPSLDHSEFIFDTADGVLAVDREQRIVLWNEGAEALLGFKSKEVLGRYCHEVLGGRGASGHVVCQVGCANMMGTRRLERVQAQDLLVRTKAGKEIWLGVSTIHLPSRWQELYVLVHLFRDISHQKEVERFVEQVRSSVAKLSLSQGTDPPSTLPPSALPAGLTRREQEVFRLLASGCSTESIAEKLFISPATARNHIRHLLGKLGVHSRLEAVTLALRTALMYVAFIAGSCIPPLSPCF